MKNFIIFVLLCVITYQAASQKPWFQNIKQKAIDYIDTTIGVTSDIAPDEDTPESGSKTGGSSGPVSGGSQQQQSAQYQATPSQLVLQDGPLINIASLQSEGSANATFSVAPDGTVALQTKPNIKKAWISFVISPSASFNYIYFDLDFTSNPTAQGVFTAFVDGKNLGYMDERFYDVGSKKQTMGFSLTSPGPHVVQFSLDEVGGVSTSVSIRNFGTGVYTE